MHCKFRELINAQIAQLVEQRTENPRVAGSIPALGIFLFFRYALEKAAPEGAAQTVDKALLLQGFAIIGTAFLI